MFCNFVSEMLIKSCQLVKIILSCFFLLTVYSLGHVLYCDSIKEPKKYFINISIVYEFQKEPNLTGVLKNNVVMMFDSI